jgi:hypothetical protein
MLYDVVSVYLTDRTVDPLTCRIKSVIMTEQLRDVDGNSYYAVRDVLMAVRQINIIQPKEAVFAPSSDIAEKYAFTVAKDILWCEPTGGDNAVRNEKCNCILSIQRGRDYLRFDFEERCRGMIQRIG